MNKYGLNFITDEYLYNHTKNTIKQYRFKVNLKQFNKNLIDLIKLTFDSKVYGIDIQGVIENEISMSELVITPSTLH